MKTRTCSLCVCLLLAGSFASRACWTFSWEPQGQFAVQNSPAVVVTPLQLRPGAGNSIFFDQLGFYDASGGGLPRDIVVGIANMYGAAEVTVPAGHDVPASSGCRWAYLDEPFLLDPDGVNYLYYFGEVGDVVRLASEFRVGIHPLFELGGSGYETWPPGVPAFGVPPDNGVYAFGANAQYVPEPPQAALVGLTMLAAAGLLWRRRWSAWH